MSDFTCTECGHEYSISSLELWDAYEQDGKETDFKCTNCEAKLIIKSTVIGWQFEAELSE